MQPPPSKKLFSAKELLAELCQAALGSFVVDMSMVLWRRVTWDAPAKDWTPSSSKPNGGSTPAATDGAPATA